MKNIKEVALNSLLGIPECSLPKRFSLAPSKDFQFFLQNLFCPGDGIIFDKELIQMLFINF